MAKKKEIIVDPALRRLIEEMQSEAAPFMTPVAITDAASCETVAERVREKKKLKSDLQEEFTDPKDDAFRTHRAICDLENTLLKPLNASIAADEKAIYNWGEQERRRVQEEARRKQAEEDAAFQKQIDKRAGQLTKAGRVEEATELRESAEFNRPIVAPEPVALPPNVSHRPPEWDFEIENPEAVPRTWCSPDERKIKETVRNLGRNAEIPGVRVFPKEMKATVR